MDTNRLDQREALEHLKKTALLTVMKQAHAVRLVRHPGNEVTFAVDSNPNYTNVCVTRCAFCSFYRNPGAPDAYVLSPEAIAQKAREAWQQGATTLLMQGGHHPELRLEYYLNLIPAIREAAPGLHPHLFCPTEIDHIAKTEGLSWERVLGLFYAAGLRTLPGGGAEILSERVRGLLSPGKTSARDWIEIMRTAHHLGFQSTATMTYGHVETDEEIIEHLMLLRGLQDETGGFYAFIPWSFKPGTSRLAASVPQAATPGRYVRLIALARLVLDNFPHIQASWFSEGWRAGQLALHAGADDFGGVLLEENVLRQARHALASTLDNVAVIIREAGFVPVQRSARYEKLRVIPEGTPAEGQPVHSRPAGA